MHLLVLPHAEELLADLAPFDKVILSQVPPQRVVPVIEALHEREITVYAVVIEGSSLQQIVSTPGLVDRLNGPFRPNQVVLRIARFDRKGVLIRLADVLSRIDARVEGPLQSAADAEAFKILTSLGVRCQIDIRQENLAWSSIEDLVTDNFLALTRRASLDPFTMLYGILNTPDSRLSLAGVYFDDCRDYLQVDRTGRLHLTRARLVAGDSLGATLADRSELEGLAPCAEAADVVRRNMQDATDCAFCGGFRACRAYLRPAYAGSECSRMFQVLHEVITLSESRRSNPDRAGGGKGVLEAPARMPGTSPRPRPEQDPGEKGFVEAPVDTPGREPRPLAGQDPGEKGFLEAPVDAPGREPRPLAGQDPGEKGFMEAPVDTAGREPRPLAGQDPGEKGFLEAPVDTTGKEPNPLPQQDKG